MSHTRLNAYHIMWLFVFFDMPVETKLQRKRAAKFRKNLLKIGFNMMQYSVYTRFCASAESAEVYQKRVEKLIEAEGNVSILTVTDKQYGMMKNYQGKKKVPKGPQTGNQLELF